MEHEAIADNWLVRRMMKLTPFEKWMMDRPQRVSQTQGAVMELFEQVCLPPDPHCLEIGCGQGVMTRLLVEHFGTPIVASDFDPDQVAAAEKRLSNLEGKLDLRVVDARDMPFGDAEFDAVFSFGVLHHLMGGWHRAVSEAGRVLGPGGWFVCTDVLPPRWMERLCGRLLRQFGLLEESHLRASLEENGLRFVHFASTGAPVAGLMRHCSFVAQKERTAVGAFEPNRRSGEPSILIQGDVQ
jgi:ubiquinone/menaquinone biosynthesis C-methylase UbiE